MTEEQKENIEISNRFLGYGDPSIANIYFFGIEEGAPFNSSKELRNIINIPYPSIDVNGVKYYFHISHENRSVKGKTENLQAYLSYRILKDVLGFENLPSSSENYKSHYFVGKENRVFCSNTYPLGARNIDDNPNILLTGFTDKNEYYDYSWQQTSNPRKEVLRNFINYIKNKRNNSNYFIFIMGTYTYPPHKGRSAQERLKPICEELGFKFDYKFPIDNEEKLFNNISKEELKWECSNCKKIWLIGHPSKGAFDERVADRIVEFLK